MLTDRLSSTIVSRVSTNTSTSVLVVPCEKNYSQRGQSSSNSSYNNSERIYCHASAAGSAPRNDPCHVPASVMMKPQIPALAQSESKAKFLARLGLIPETEQNRRIYGMMKVRRL